MCYMILFQTKMVFYQDIHVFLQLRLIGLFGAKEPKYTLKHLRFRKYFFQKLTQFAQGHTVVDGAACNTGGFDSTYKRVSSF
jgi:hypothetical protein